MQILKLFYKTMNKSNFETMTRNQDMIKLNSKFRVPMDTYLDIIEESKRGTTGNDLCAKHKVSYSTITRIRDHARKTGLLEMTEKHIKLAETRKKMRKAKQAAIMREAKRQRTEQKTEAKTTTTTTTTAKETGEKGFIKVNFKGTEIHVEKTGTIFVTSEGIIVK